MPRVVPSSPILVALDSKDLIALGHDDARLAALRSGLTAANARLVLSVPVIHEVAAPLRTGTATGVMALCNTIEGLPHVWLRTVDLQAREVATAVRCWRAGKAYEPVAPLVPSFIDTILKPDDRLRAYYQHRPLSEVLWDSYVGGRPRSSSIGARYPDIVAVNRKHISGWNESEYRKRRREAFISMIRTYVPEPPDRFLEHVWKSPDWAPATQLQFEVFQTLLADRATKPRPSDLEDFTLVLVLPYVALFTTDKAKRDYLRRIRASCRMERAALWSRCHIEADLDAVVRRLAEHAR